MDNRVKKYQELTPAYYYGRRFYEAEYAYFDEDEMQREWKRVTCKCGSEHWYFEKCWECEKKKIDWNLPDIPF
jgi:predicted DNA-binding WGR domain protein